MRKRTKILIALALMVLIICVVKGVSAVTEKQKAESVQDRYEEKVLPKYFKDNGINDARCCVYTKGEPNVFIDDVCFTVDISVYSTSYGKKSNEEKYKIIDGIDDLELEGADIQIDDLAIICGDDEYTIYDDNLHKNNISIYPIDDNEYIKSLKKKNPFEGLESDYIDFTKLGEHDKEKFHEGNMIYDEDEGECTNLEDTYTIYYWFYKKKVNGQRQIKYEVKVTYESLCGKLYGSVVSVKHYKKQKNKKKINKKKKINNKKSTNNSYNQRDPVAEDIFNDYGDFNDYEDAEDYYNSDEYDEEEDY